jgi:hypothetical protein
MQVLLITNSYECSTLEQKGIETSAHLTKERRDKRCPTPTFARWYEVQEMYLTDRMAPEMRRTNETENKENIVLLQQMQIESSTIVLPYRT